MSTVGAGPVPQSLVVPFFALRPQGEVLPELARLRAEVSQRFGLRSPVPDERLHLSLCEAGRPARLREPYEHALRKAGDGTTGVAMDLVFDRLRRYGGGGGSQCLVLTADAASIEVLNALRRNLAVAQLFNGLVAGAKSASPHITLGYADQLPPVDEAIAPIRWHVREFVLIGSHQGKSVHEELGRWPLG